MSDRSFTIVCCVISFLFSLLATAIAYKAKDITTIKREKYFNFYYPFYTLWDSIHQARAFNFSDLDKEDQDKIMGFLIEHSPYADAKLNEQIYILKCSRLENFNNMDIQSIEAANQVYNQIIDMMIDKENSLRKKYIAKRKSINNYRIYQGLGQFVDMTGFALPLPTECLGTQTRIGASSFIRLYFSRLSCIYCQVPLKNGSTIRV